MPTSLSPLSRKFMREPKVDLPTHRAGSLRSSASFGSVENRKSPEAFTLIELLVVIAIIAILAGLVLRTAGFVQTKGATSRAEAEIAAISTALESYKVDYGDYPINTAASNNNAILVSSLVYSNTNYNPLGKIYLSLPKSSFSGTNSILDPFGQPYNYEYNPTNATLAHRSGSNFFDLWSTAGSSGNSNKWIKNW